MRGHFWKRKALQEFLPLLVRWESFDRGGKRLGSRHPNDCLRVQSRARGDRSHVRCQDGGSQPAGAVATALSTLFLPGQVLSDGVNVLVTQSCPTLCDHMGCSPPDSSVHGILQARRLEWVAISFLREIFPTQGSNPCLLHCRRILCLLSHQGSPKYCLRRLMGKGGVGGGTGCLCWGPVYRPRGWVLLSLWVSL